MPKARLHMPLAKLTASAPCHFHSPDNAMMQQMTEGKQQQMSDLESFQIGDRANFTLAAFESLVSRGLRLPGPQEPDLAVH